MENLTPKPKRRLRKSMWLPVILLLYMGVLMAFNAGEWISTGHTLRVVITGICELLIITALYFALRRREKLEDRRKDIERKMDEIK